MATQKQSSSQSQQHPSSQNSSNDFHDYHAPSLPDPMLDSSGSDSPTESRARSSSDHHHHHVMVGTKHVCTDSSSGDDEDKMMATTTTTTKPSATKKRKIGNNASCTTASTNNVVINSSSATMRKTESMDISNGNTSPNTTTNNTASLSISQKMPQKTGLPPNIARSGGISHNIRPVVAIQPATTTATTATTTSTKGKAVSLTSSSCPPNGNSRLNLAPAIALPPFVGIGKRAPIAGVNATTTVGAAAISKPSSMATAVESASNILPTSNGTTKSPSLVLSNIKSSSNNNSIDTTTIPTTNGIGSNGSGGLSTASTANGVGVGVGGGGTSVIGTVDNDTASSIQSSNQQFPQIQAYYHVNEDDMLLTDDVLMCPFIFRSQDAVLCGALAECIMPGMLRAHFSSRNKLCSLEMVYDSMGFMQQLERASCSEGTAQIIPNSLEMALSPNTNEARVITLAKPPYLIVSVNEAWARTTKYTQMEVEGKEMSVLHGKKTDPDAGKRPGKPSHEMMEVAKGNCACSVNIHYDKHGKEFVDFVCSYPLTNGNDEITHILHICKELPEPTTPENVFPDAPSNGSVSFQEQ
uniref:PAS domain-containing protein n=1 Tax=Ditylum brightwellii TaxID=49249 RepID=A0A7S1Z1U9_9STRA